MNKTKPNPRDELSMKAPGLTNGKQDETVVEAVMALVKKSPRFHERNRK